MEKTAASVLTFGLRRLRLSRPAKFAKIDMALDSFYRHHPERLEHLKSLAKEAREEERAELERE